MDTPPPSSKSLSNSSIKNSLTPCRRVGLGRPSTGSFKKLVQVQTISTPPSGSSHNSNQNSLPPLSESETPAYVLPSKVSNKPNWGQNKEIHKVKRCLTENSKSNCQQSEKQTIHEYKVKSERPTSLHKIRDNCDSLVKNGSCTNGKAVKKLKSELSPTTRASLKGHGNKISLVCKTDSIKLSADENVFETNEEISEENIEKLVLTILEKRKKLDQVKVQENYAKKHKLEELRAQTAKWRASGQEALRHCVRLAGRAGYSVTISQLMEQHGFPPDLMGYNADDDEFQ